MPFLAKTVKGTVVMKGFIRKQEEQLAYKLLKWQHERDQLPLPEPSVLRHHAERIVEDAHEIARQRGKNVFNIIRELINEVKNR